MDDWGILGLSIGTVANLAVAGATLVLVIYTYKSVKASEEQVTMNQKEKERPIVLEFINSHLNPIRDDLNNDPQIIEKNEINEFPHYPIHNRDYGTLVIPVSARKDFHIKFSVSNLPRFLQSNKSLKGHAHLISDQLKYRCGIYYIINQKIESLHKELVETTFYELIKTGYMTGPEITDFFSIDRESDPETGEEIFNSTIGIRQDQNNIPRQTLIEAAKNLIILSLFENQGVREFLSSKGACIFPTDEAISRIKSLLQRLDNQEVFSLRREIENELYDLNKTDNLILQSVSEIKRLLQDRYLFTDKELN